MKTALADVDAGSVQQTLSKTKLESLLEVVGPEGHVTCLLGADDSQPAFQVELLCEATDWKSMRLGDATLAGVLDQALQAAKAPVNADKAPDKKTTKKTSTKTAK